MDAGEKYVVEYEVLTSDTAKYLSISAEDDFPDVLATSRMVALMELAAARLMKGLLTKDQLSVGVNVNVNHLAATPVGSKVKAIAVFEGMVDKMYSFKVELHDGGGLAGSGKHTRAIIETVRLLEGASRRTQT